MFIKKDLRKIPKILEDAVVCSNANDDSDNMDSPTMAKDASRDAKRPKVEAPLSVLRLSRRHQEFQGSMQVLCGQPQYLPKLQCLQNLNVYDCGIASLEGIGLMSQCPQLEILNVGRNPLTTLPDDLAALRGSLKELWLDDCQLTGPLPKCVLELDRLESFRAPNNHITSIPNNFGPKMKSLKVLVLDRNPLGEGGDGGGNGNGNGGGENGVPEDLSGLQQLEELYLRHTQLTQLPRRLPTKSLKVLHLSSNPLTNVEALLNTTSSAPGGLAQLTHLYLNGCHLQSLPPGIVSQHPKLQRLVVSHNPSLRHAPIDMWHAIRGKELVADSAEIVWQPNPQLEEGTTEKPPEEDKDIDNVEGNGDGDDEDDNAGVGREPSSSSDEEEMASSAMEGVELSNE